MNAPDRSGIVDAPAQPSAAQSFSDIDAMIAALRAAGAGRFDPVRLHYVETLAKRAAVHRGSVRQLLDARLEQALSALKERFEHAQAEASETVERCTQQSPRAAAELQRLFAAGDFKEVQRRAAAANPGEQGFALGALVRRLDQQSAENTGARPQEKGGLQGGLRPELKTVRTFRETLAKLSVDKQVTQALAQAPKNAGPINSHMLVLRSLALMRDISPDYLNRFMSYADALLCLDQFEKEKPASPKKSPATRAAKK